MSDDDSGGLLRPTLPEDSAGDESPTGREGIALTAQSMPAGPTRTYDAWRAGDVAEEMRSHSALAFDVSALGLDDPLAGGGGGKPRRCVSELDVDALRRLTVHGSGARSQPMLGHYSELLGGPADAGSNPRGSEPAQRPDHSGDESGATPSSSGTEDALPQLGNLGRMAPGFQPTYGHAPKQSDSRTSMSASLSGAAAAGDAASLQSGGGAAGAPGAIAGTVPFGSEGDQDGWDAPAVGSDADDEDESSMRAPGAHQKHPFATVIINGYQLLRCHFPSFHRETTSRAFPVHQNSETACKTGHRFRFVCYTHYSCPKAYNIRARLIMDGKPSEPSVVIELGVLRPKTDVISVSHTLDFAPTSVRFTLKKVNVNHGFSAELEAQLVDLVSKMILVEIETQGYGSLSAFQVQCRFEDTEIYREVVGRKYNNSWHRFLTSHRDRFTTFYYTKEEIQKSGLYPYAKFHEARVLVRGHEQADFKAKDQQKAAERNTAERALLDRIELILARSPDGWVDEHELLRYLQTEPSFLTFLSPMYSALMRFMRRHKDQFVWVTQPFLPTRFGLKEAKGDEAKAIDDAKRSGETVPAGRSKVPAISYVQSGAATKFRSGSPEAASRSSPAAFSARSGSDAQVTSSPVDAMAVALPTRSQQSPEAGGPAAHAPPAPQPQQQQGKGYAGGGKKGGRVGKGEGKGYGGRGGGKGWQDGGRPMARQGRQQSLHQPAGGAVSTAGPAAARSQGQHEQHQPQHQHQQPPQQHHHPQQQQHQQQPQPHQGQQQPQQQPQQQGQQFVQQVACDGSGQLFMQPAGTMPVHMMQSHSLEAQPMQQPVQQAAGGQQMVLVMPGGGYQHIGAASNAQNAQFGAVAAPQYIQMPMGQMAMGQVPPLQQFAIVQQGQQ